MATIAELSLGRLFCDFIVLLCLALPLLIFQEWVKPVKRGFYCDDESIRYPYKASTVTRKLLIVVGILIPTILIFLTEMLRALAWERRCANEFGTYRCRKYNVHRLVVRLYIFIGYFLLGVCFNQLMVDIANYTIGRQRPHFMDVCKPFTTTHTRLADGTIRDVSMDYRTNCPTEEHRYITDFECKGSSEYLIHESKLSFYSGHSAFSLYAAWYTSLYLQARVYRPLFSQLMLPAVQFSLFGAAAFVSYTRVSDFKHHWSDVLVGIIIGSIIGIINALFIAEVFQRREVPVAYRSRRRIIGKYSNKAADLEAGNVLEMQDMVESQRGRNNANSANKRAVQIGHPSEQQKQTEQPQQVHNVPIRIITPVEEMKLEAQLPPRRC